MALLVRAACRGRDHEQPITDDGSPAVWANESTGFPSRHIPLGQPSASRCEKRAPAACGLNAAHPWWPDVRMTYFEPRERHGPGGAPGDSHRAGHAPEKPPFTSV